jgi:hypothetical protein
MIYLTRKHLYFIAAILIVLLFHGTLLINQSFYRTYDAIIHIFFGSHYAQSWFDPWEPRWYTGFTVFSYPPLGHQFIGALSWLLDLRAAFVVVQLSALLIFVLGLYRFAQLFVSTRAAGYACILLVVSSSLVETVHVFGQLPTTLSLGLLLNAQPFAISYLRFGKRQDLLKALGLFAVTTTAHHVTTLFGSVFFVMPLILTYWLQARKQPRPLEPQQKQKIIYRMLPRTYRAGLLLFSIACLLILMVLPYWLWSRNDPITQTPIPHASRDNFFVNPNAGMMFFTIPWASSFIFLPYALYKGFTTWRWTLAASLLLLTILGTGGTTPIPKFILRSAFDILTLERFTFWATILTLPFAGMALESLLYGNLQKWLDANWGRRIRLVLLATGIIFTVTTAVFISGLTRLRQFQPEPINMKPITQFIEKDEHWRYRYLTLGFGDQMAWLSANTRALTPDGNYHSARRLIELTSTPVERLDGAKYTGVPGLGSLEDFMIYPERFNLKFVFSNDTFYDPLLYFNGWHQVVRLENGIMVWEREDIAPLPERLPRPTISLWQRLLWGCLPFLAVLTTIFLLFQKPRKQPLFFWHTYKIGKSILRFLKQDASPDVFLEHIPITKFLSFERLSVSVRRYRVIGLSCAGIFIGCLVWFLLPRDTPENTVYKYWNDIDFGRFTQSYTRIAAQNGLTLERYLLDRSVQGGLLVNYAKLEKIRTKLLGISQTEAVVQADLTWMTSLTSYPQTITHELTRTNQGWQIKQAPILKTRSTQRFMTDPTLEYFRAPRRLTTATSDARDILDRPQLQISNERLISWMKPTGETVYTVLGELENLDARPADCTVTVVLRDSQGRALAQNNVGLEMIHKLLPGERTTFRLDFLGVAAPSDFDIAAKAVVTQIDLQRPLAIWIRPHSISVFKTQIINVSTKNVVIPRALISFYDTFGLAWLDVQTIPEQIQAHQTIERELIVSFPEKYRLIKAKRNLSEVDTVFDVKNQVRPPSLSAPLVNSKFLKYRVQMQAFGGTP